MESFVSVRLAVGVGRVGVPDIFLLRAPLEVLEAILGRVEVLVIGELVSGRGRHDTEGL
jgi:hypothetical protein